MPTSKIYVKIDDAMNKQKFAVYIPEWYEPAGLNNYFIHYQTEPFYQPYEHNMTESRLSPVKIVQAVEQDVPIEFKEKNDIRLLKNILSSYLRSMEDFKNESKEVEVFLESVRKTLARVDEGIADLVKAQNVEGTRFDLSGSQMSDLIKRAFGGEE